MQKLVHTLEAQHRALEKIVQEIDAAVLARDGEVLPDRLAKLESALHAHLALENAQFYPAFLKLADQHGRSRDAELAKLFSSNMKLIADGLGQFLSRYRNPPADFATFEADWRATVKVLSQRIASEEQTLHSMFTRLGG